MKKFKLISIILLTAIISSFLTYNYTKETNDYAIVDRAKAMLEKYYYEDIDSDKQTEGMLYGLAQSLGDPYTNYLSSKDYEYYDQLATGSYSGLGISISSNKDDRYITIVTTFDNTPAKEAGLATGDKIIAIDGVAYTSDKLDDASSKMKGKEGTKVKITVLKKGKKSTKELTLTRRKINIPSTESKLINNNIAYIKINSFDGRMAEEFAGVFNNLVTKGAKKLIIDLRDNPGGLVGEAVSVADMFLDKGKAIFYSQNKEGKKDWTYANERKTEIPIIVLTNGGSASASEILTGALRDNKLAKVVGEKTYGKGVIQGIYPLNPLRTSDGYLKITIAKYFTPNGTDINHKGIVPDIKVKGEKAQLERAIDELK